MKTIIKFFALIAIVALVSSCKKEPLPTPVVPVLPTTPTSVTTTTPTSITTTTTPTTITTTTPLVNDTVGKTKVVFSVRFFDLVTAPYDYKYDTTNAKMTLNGKHIVCEKEYSAEGNLITYKRVNNPIWMALGDTLVLEMDSIEINGAYDGVGVNTIYNNLAIFKNKWVTANLIYNLPIRSFEPLSINLGPRAGTTVNATNPTWYLGKGGRFMYIHH